MRRTPLPVRGAAGGAQQLAAITGLDALLCRRVLESHLLAGWSASGSPESGKLSCHRISAAPVHQQRRHRLCVARTRKACAAPRALDKRRFVSWGPVTRALAAHRSCGQVPFVAQETTLKMAECLSLETSVRHRQTVASTLASCTSARNVPGPMIRLAMSVCPMIGSNGP